jgi:hypothetical protein
VPNGMHELGIGKIRCKIIAEPVYQHQMLLVV